MLRFDAPFWLLALALLPFLWLGELRGLPGSIPIPSCDGTPGLPRSLRIRTRWLVPACQLLAAVCVTLGLARPQWSEVRTTTSREGIDLVLALDASDTMGALDFELDGRRVNRLEAVKAVVKDFLPQRPGDRIGVVAFGSEARTAVPRTIDHRALAKAVEQIALGSMGDSTALGDALVLAVKRLGKDRKTPGAVVLLTDGRSNTGTFSPAEGAAVAAVFGAKVYVIAVGNDGPVPVPVADPLGGRRILQRRLEVDEPTLRAVAADTGGRFFRVQGLDGLREVYREIDGLEKSPSHVRTFESRQELYPEVLGAALVFFLLAAVGSATVFAELP